MIQFLIQPESLTHLKKGYSGVSFDEVFSKSLDSNLVLWQEQLRNLPTDTLQKRESERVFARPSLWEEDCPRMIKDEYAMWDLSQKFAARNESHSRKKALLKGFSESDSLWKAVFASALTLQFIKENKLDSAHLFSPFITQNRVLKADISFLIDSHFVDSVYTTRQLIWRTEKNRDAFFQMNYLRQIPSEIPTDLVPLAFSVLSEHQTKEIPISLRVAIKNHVIDFDFIRWYLIGAEWLAELHEFDVALTLLTRLELSSSKAQHRFLIQQSFRYVQYLKEKSIKT